jgi:hypothetical protein
MRVGLGIAGLIVAVMTAPACSTKLPDAPELVRVDPSRASLTQLPLPVTIHGRAFFKAPRVNFDDPNPPVSAPFRLTLGGMALERVNWISSEQLEARITVGLGVGSHHRLELVDPRGRRASRANAFEVIGDNDGPLDVDQGRDGGSLDFDQGRDGTPDQARAAVKPIAAVVRRSSLEVGPCCSTRVMSRVGPAATKGAQRPELSA